MQLTYLTHIRDDVLPSLAENERHAFLKQLKRARCIPNNDGEYVYASEFYDPRSEVFRIMESSNKFPPPPFNETKWLDFLIEIGMVEVVDERLFMKFACRVALMSNLSPNDETCRERSKTLLSFFFRHHHLHSPQFLQNISTVKFIASEKVEEFYLSLHRQHCCSENADHPPFVQFSNAVPWKYRPLVWTSAHLLPNLPELSSVCCGNQECNTESLHKHLQVKYPSPDMVISHLQNISQVLVEYSKNEHELPDNPNITKVMDGIYKFLQKAASCPSPQISAECKDICRTIGTRLSNTSCVLVDDAKSIVSGNQLSFKIREDKSLQPYIYEVPRKYGEFVHLLKRLGATETITPFQLVNVLNKMKARIRDDQMNPDLQKKAHNAMFLLFDFVLNEAKEENQQSSISSVRELYLPSEDKRLMRSSELLCKIPPRHINTITRLSYHALCFFETVGLQRELESKYLEALPVTLRPKPFDSVVEEKLDESCLDNTCRLCSEGNECNFIKKFSALLKSEQFKNGIIRLLKHQKKSGSLKPQEEQAASRFFSNKVEVKCMRSVKIHLMLVDTEKTVEGSSTSRNCYVVKQNDAWTLYMEHGKVRGNLMKSINKILDWRIKEEFLFVVSDMVNCSTSLEIPSVLNEHDIDVDAGRNEEVNLGSEVPVVFHQMLQQNPLFVFHIGERVAYCVDENEDNELSPIKYILAEIVERVTSNSVESPYDLKARYLIDIGCQKIEVSVLDLYKFYENYPDVNLCRDLMPFTGDVEKMPESYEEAKRKILEALRAARRLPPDLRRKAIKRLYLRWHPDKNPNNKEFATEMMAFVSEQVQQMIKEEMQLEEEPENVNYVAIFQEYDVQATQENATFINFVENLSSSEYSPSPSGLFPFIFNYGHTETYTSPNPREARRWIEQAEGDLRLCRYSLRGTELFHASACFMSQQIVEKSLKAALYKECGLTDDQLHSHDVRSLARNVQMLPRWQRMTNIVVVNLALVVANYYLPTRYPNQQPYPIVPFNAFDDQSENAISSAEKIFQDVKRFIET